MSEANKDIIRRYQEAYNTDNLDLLDELVAPDWKTNGWPEGIPQSLEAAKESYRAVREGFPDLQFHTVQLVAEGDWVVQRWLMRGTFKNEILGLSPTGRVVEGGGISMFRISEGNIVEHCAYADDTGFWHQLGVDVPGVMLTFAHRTPTSGAEVS